MTPDQMRVAIAGDQGWKWHGDKSWEKLGDMFYWKHENPVRVYSPLPNYPSDLNACHEFEVKMDDDQFNRYLAELMPGRPIPRFASMDDYRKAFKATAPQRCEAYCRMKFPERFKQ